jgi:hypothetical protein
MAAVDQAALIRGWVADEIGRCCLGEDYKFAVLTQAAASPAGNMLGFMIVVQARSPLLGAPPGVSLNPVTLPDPGEELIRQAARDAVTGLRDWAAQQLSVQQQQ